MKRENIHEETTTNGLNPNYAGTYTINEYTFCNSANVVSEQFKVVYELIKKGAVTCEEAWTLMLNIVPRKTEYVPYTPYQPVYYTTPGTPSTDPYKIYCSHSVAKTGDSPLK